MAYLKSTNIDGDLIINGGNISLSETSNIIDSDSNPVVFQNKLKQRTGEGHIVDGDYISKSYNWI